MRLKNNITGFILLVLAIPVNILYGQNIPSIANKRLLLLGESMATYVHDSTQSQLRDIRFHLLPIVEVTEKALLITEFGVETFAGSPDLTLEQVQLCYEIAPDINFYAGRFFPKFGSYRARYGAAFINRMSTDPVGFGPAGIGPLTETGIGFVGGFQLGYSKIGYDIYISNGPELISEGSEAGRFEYEAYLANNKNKAIGGRVAFLPLSSSSLEIGFSFQGKTKTGNRLSEYEDIYNMMYAIDLDFVKRLDMLKSTARFISEYKSVEAKNAYYKDPADPLLLYTFTNSSYAWYAQTSIRPTDSENEFISDLELVVRYSEFQMPEGSLWAEGHSNHLKQTAVGINYFLTWDTIIKLMYQSQTEQPEKISAQIVYRF